MLKLKSNRLRIFENLVPKECKEHLIDKSNVISKKQISNNQNILQFKKNCILDEKYFETGNNTIDIIIPIKISEEVAYSLFQFYGEISHLQLTHSKINNTEASSLIVSFYDLRSSVLAFLEMNLNLNSFEDEKKLFKISFSEIDQFYYENYFFKISFSKPDFPKDKLIYFLNLNCDIFKVYQNNNEMIVQLYNSKDHSKISFILEKVCAYSHKVVYFPWENKYFENRIINKPQIENNFILNSQICENNIKKNKNWLDQDLKEKEETYSTSDSSHSVSSNFDNNYFILYDQNYSGIRKRNTPDLEKAKYIISVQNIINNLDNRTTLMIKNIPKTLSQINLLEEINERNKGNFNFFYLPIDFKTKLNVGYAFINFKEPNKIVNFFIEFNKKKWNIQVIKTKKIKVCYLSYARIQGLRCILDHFKRSSIMKQIDEKLKPIVL